MLSIDHVDVAIRDVQILRSINSSIGNAGTTVFIRRYRTA